MTADEIIEAAREQAEKTGEVFSSSSGLDEFQWAINLLSQYNLGEEEEEYDG